jgi:hypothetical protein
LWRAFLLFSAGIAARRLKVHQGTIIDRFSRRPAGRLLLIVFAALALFLQSYAAQSHFHAQSGSAALSMQAAQQTGKHHQPASNDSDGCPLCQSLYSGQYVAPNLAAWFLPTLAVSIIEATSVVSPHYDTVSHSWRGRGPPHH